MLTKPLGTQVAVSGHTWLDQADRWNRIKLVVSEDDMRKAYQRAMDSMTRLNRVGKEYELLTYLHSKFVNCSIGRPIYDLKQSSYFLIDFDGNK